MAVRSRKDNPAKSKKKSLWGEKRKTWKEERLSKISTEKVEKNCMSRLSQGIDVVKSEDQLFGRGARKNNSRNNRVLSLFN